MQERSLMVCASSEEKELHWLREDLASKGSGEKKKSPTLSPQQKSQKEIKT